MTAPASSAGTPLSADAQALLSPWPGPFGGLPPFDHTHPASLEAAYTAAVADQRARLQAIATDPAAPDFENTVEALERSSTLLRRVQCLVDAHALTNAIGDMPALARRLAPLRGALDDEIAHDDRLVARVQAVHAQRDALGLIGDRRRLVEVWWQRLSERGAGLPPAPRQRLAEINGQLASLIATFGQHLRADQGRVLWLDGGADLAGTSAALQRSMAQAAAAAGRPDAWAVPNERPIVWPFLTQSTRRDLRERVWREWNTRGDHRGDHDNRPVMAEILALRGEKARLLGHPSFAHLATASRMARTPEAALSMLRRTWAAVHRRTLVQIAELQALADADDPSGRAPPLAPWDRLFWSERLRQSRFGIDAEAVQAHLPLDGVIDAMCWAAGRLHGLRFERLHDAPVLHPSVRVLGLWRGDEPVGVLYVDLFSRPGKGHGSFQMQWRSHEVVDGRRVLPISSLVSSRPLPADGEPMLLPWEYANVYFHEFGHALHMLLNQAPYPSLGSQHVAWDFVELPALLNERWLADRTLLQRFARHHATGEPMPLPMIESLERSLQHDRIFSVNLDYLGPAIVDLELHLRTDGSPDAPTDAVAVEDEVMHELGMPAAWDQIMRMPHSVHAFSNDYAAGVYVYLWADVMAADVAEAFHDAPGGLYDPEVAERWRREVLAAAHRVPADEAFRRFRGRDPDPDALLRRFGLLEAAPGR